MEFQSICVVGLGTMGANLALNLADKGYQVHLFNRTHSKAIDLANGSAGMVAHSTINSMVASTASPRVIFLMVPAGPTVDSFLNRLRCLNEEDIVIDGGNSDYVDTERRVSECRFNFVGCGISGGEYGARHGPAMMVGCAWSVYTKIRPILESISAAYEGGHCCGWMGTGGAGHFVKAVHNGIEYSEMQLLQETFNMCVGAGTDEEIEALRVAFTAWNGGRLNGYLMEICARILGKEENETRIVGRIMDDAKQKGTGKICIRAALETGTDAVAMGEAVMARFMSAEKNLRGRFSRVAGSAREKGAVNLEDVEKAFCLCKAICFVQGFRLLMAEKTRNGWEFDVNGVCDTWRGGCILRCSMIDEFKKMAMTDDFVTSEEFIKMHKAGLEPLKRVVSFAVSKGVYAPVFASCLMWLNGLGMPERNGSLIQAMRDYFGRHGVVMDDGREMNIDWE